MLNLYGSVLTSIQHLTVVSKHDGSDSTALPNENGQLGVGLLQIDIVAFNKLPTNKTHYRHHFHKNYVPHRIYAKAYCNHTLELAIDLELYQYTV